MIGLQLPFNPSPLQSVTTVSLTKVIFQVIEKPLYSCVSLLQQQFMSSVGETTIFCTFYVYYTSSSFNFILVVISVVAADVVAVVAVVTVVSVGISIVVSSAITAKLDR